MAQISNIENAINGGFLWPPIADTLDTYLRRRLSNADPYEQTWRLIHVWEATAIMLSVTAMSLIQHSENLNELGRRQRELFYGKSWDQVKATFKEGKGAADGSINQWISILDEITKTESFESRYLQSLKDFLSTEQIQMGALLNAWSKACDVPSDLSRQDKLKLTQAMRCVNSFRNRFAHVPFPHDPLAEINDALLHATEQLFGIQPLPSKHEKDGKSNPLTGALLFKRSFLRGGQFLTIDTNSEQIQFRFPSQKQGEKAESWPAQVFMYIDAMMRPHVITRVKKPYSCEYTRFRAEANAILSIDDENLIKILPEPAKSEYQLEEEKEDVPEREVTMADAIEAISSEEYDKAINICQELVDKRPSYHTAWLRLGYARREKAVRLPFELRKDAIVLLNEAAQAFNKAIQHKNDDRKALAHYEKSKAYYHINRLNNEDKYLRLSKEEAENATKYSSETKYQSWQSYLQPMESKSSEPAINELVQDDI